MEEANCVVDAGTEFVLWDLLDRGGLPYPTVRPYTVDRIRKLPPWARQPAVTSMAVKPVHTIGRSKRAVFCVEWTPDGRRLLSGTMGGEFMLYHGMNYSLEMIMQAHESAVRCMRYSPAGDWLISGDQDGGLKVWQPNFNNVKMARAHSDTLRGICWSPSGTKFATCSDDGSVKVWSFALMTQENTFSGKNAHGWDVKCVDWHPTLGLLASGSKDNTMRLWDPRQKQLLTTVHAFKNTVSKTKFQPTGGQHLLAAACRDHTAYVFDLRMLRREHMQTVATLGEKEGAGNHSAEGSGVAGSQIGNKPNPKSNNLNASGAAVSASLSAHPILPLNTDNAITDYIDSSSTYTVLRGHSSDVSALEWHPYHPQLLATGTHEGSMHYFLLDNSALRNEVGHMHPAWSIEGAHQSPVWDLSWHPVGHLMASGSNDRSLKIWKRADVGDKAEDLQPANPEEVRAAPPPKKKSTKPPGL